MDYEGENFEKGVKQLMKQIEEVYTDKNGVVFWGLTPTRYYAAISFNLDILLHLRMYIKTQNPAYLTKSLSKLHYLETNLTKLLDPVTGLIHDGTHGFDLSREYYTYN